MQTRHRIGMWIALFAAGAAVLIGCTAGCQNRNSVRAEPRQSTKQPVFVDLTSETNEANDSTWIDGHDFSFLRSDHFACFSLNVRQIRSNKTLKEVDWDRLIDAMGSAVGEANVAWDRIERLWLLADSEFLELAGGFGAEPKSQPWVIVIDYENEFDSDALAEAQRKRQASGAGHSAAEKEELPTLVAEQLGPRRIALGSKETVEKLQTEEKPGRRTLEHPNRST